MTETPNPGGLPRGAGSMMMRRRCWWLIYTDENGRIVQESSYTDDAAKARRMLTGRAIAVCEARLQALRNLLNEEETAAAAGSKRRTGHQPGHVAKGRRAADAAARSRARKRTRGGKEHKA